MGLLKRIIRHRYTPVAALVLAAAAGGVYRYAAMDAISPREFSYMIESCIRFRYAEMRMMGGEPPALDLEAQWPEGFAVDRMILSLPDRTAALFYKVHGGDTFLATRTLINILSAVGVGAFALLALAALRRPAYAAGATLVYAVTFGAFSRSWSNYLREDFAMPGLLAATAGTLYLLTSDGRKGRWFAAAGVALATCWAGSCWHMSQFYVALLGLAVVAYAVADRRGIGAGRAALAGVSLWLGLALAAALNKPLWVKGAFWNVSAALAFAPALAWAAARILRRPERGRWFALGAAALLVGLSLAFGRSAGYGHVYELVWAKIIHLGKYPGPEALSADARMFWVGPYESPGGFRAFIEYGPLALAAGAGFVLWVRDAARRRPATGVFVAAAAAATAVLYLLMSRLTIFLAPWVAVLAFYAVVAFGRARWRAVAAVVLAGLAFFHSYVAVSHGAPRWLQAPLKTVTGFKADAPWYYGSERVDLLLWLSVTKGPPEPQGPVLADFALSPAFLYLAGRSIVLNPMFEVPEVRRKALAYAEAAVSDEDTFYRQCGDWGVNHVVHFAPQVLSTGAGSFYNTAARMPEPASAAYEMQFHPEKLRRFRLVFETYNARVFEVGKPYDGYAATAYHPLYDPNRFPDVPTAEDLDAFYRDQRRAEEYYTLACAAQDAGDFVAAAAALGSVLRLHPDYEDANLRLGFCNLKLNQTEDARRALERAAASRPHDPRARRYLDLLGGSGGRTN
ncbi:MAG: tetratricopeptide repeat protein [Candidatus Zixiibacteriota bacterium]|jgi:hypothetical protein